VIDDGFRRWLLAERDAVLAELAANYPDDDDRRYVAAASVALLHHKVSVRLHSEMPANAYIADEAPPFDSEPMRAAVAARAILDDAGRDPDDLLSMLSRQLLRSRETADRLRGDNEVLRLQLRAKRWTTDRAEAEGGDEMERLREALRFYAYPDQVKAEASWSDGYPGGIVWREPGAVHIDTGEIARTALTPAIVDGHPKGRDSADWLGS
jgi:hypothetical protein